MGGGGVSWIRTTSQKISSKSKAPSLAACLRAVRAKDSPSGRKNCRRFGCVGVRLTVSRLHGSKRPGSVTSATVQGMNGLAGAKRKAINIGRVSDATAAEIRPHNAGHLRPARVTILLCSGANADPLQCFIHWRVCGLIMATEYGWLIEKLDENGSPVWAAFEDGSVVWMSDANDACRFARQEDAKQMKVTKDRVVNVVEHGFDDGQITADLAVKLIKELAPKNSDADYREAVLEIVADVR